MCNYDLIDHAIMRFQSLISFSAILAYLHVAETAICFLVFIENTN